jgi:hypothetical protein
MDDATYRFGFARFLSTRCSRVGAWLQPAYLDVMWQRPPISTAMAVPDLVGRTTLRAKLWCGTCGRSATARLHAEK